MSDLLTAGGHVNFAEPRISPKKTYKADAMFCVQCGRLVGKNPWWVECINGGSEIRLQDGTPADFNDPGYMGCWPVGNECAKTFSTDVIFKRNETNK